MGNVSCGQRLMSQRKSAGCSTFRPSEPRVKVDEADPSARCYTPIGRRLLVNFAAFENLKRVLRTVPDGELDMQDWTRCAIAHAAKDRWFRARRLRCSFGNASRVFGIGYSEAVAL